MFHFPDAKYLDSFHTEILSKSFVEIDTFLDDKISSKLLLLFIESWSVKKKKIPKPQNQKEKKNPSPKSTMSNISQ